jgi:hypothetical protein
VVATVLAWIVLGEHLGPAQLAGGAVVLIGALVAQTSSVEPLPIAWSRSRGPNMRRPNDHGRRISVAKQFDVVDQLADAARPVRIHPNWRSWRSARASSWNVSMRGST